METGILILKSTVIEPTEHHKGWVEVEFIDTQSHYTPDQIRIIEEYVTDDMLPPLLNGFRANRGVFDYDNKYFGIEFFFSVPQEILDRF